ncbi:retrovirus-related pol polyprotein from transposon TNT 1-94 [Tanacetum coccineum]
MSTSNAYQQSLADAGSETRPSMLKREPRTQKEEDLRGDDLKHYEAEIEAMKLILISIPNDIYNSVDACTTTKAMWQRKLVNASRAKKLEKSHDPLTLVAHTGDTVQNNSDDPLTSVMILLTRAITQNFSNPTNNRLRTSSNTINQAIVQGDRVNIQSENSGNDGRNTRRSYVQEEVIESNNVQNDARNIQRTLRTASSGIVANVQCYNCSEKGHYARNCPKPRIRDSKYFMEQMLLAKQDEAGVILTDEQNDFLFADVSRMEEIEELSANICLMVQNPSTSYVNPLFAKDNQEQKYPTQPKINNKSIGDNQIDSNIIFDEPNEDVYSGSVENDNNVQDSYELEQLAR